jgi:2-polyprenyl-6-methoxyphenol hydroxylase-like FAD-dependent oxidoreductase
MRAIVIGGGIGGLAVAVALRRRGIEGAVYEKSAAPREVGAGISLWPNAVKALRKIGLGDALDTISMVSEESALRRWTGAYISRTRTEEMERRFGGGVIAVHRVELLDMLLTEVGSANIQLGYACTGIEEDATGVTATFANGATARGDLLIGADGIRSAVRELLGHRDPLRFSGYTAWRAVVAFDSSAMVPGETWGPGARFGMLPIQHDRVYWYATRNTPEGARDPEGGAKKTLLSMFEGWHDPIEELIRATSAPDILRNDIYDRDPMPSWGNGRVTLLGDAAHAMTPNLGQGACQAIEDALELAHFLSVKAGVESALKAYEASRIPRTRAIVLDSRRLGDIAQIENRILCRLRDTALQLTPTSVTYNHLAPVLSYEKHLAD